MTTSTYVETLTVDDTTGGTTTKNITKGLKGTATNDNAAAGIVGEYVESVIGSTNLPATTVYGDATSISLTAGDWDLSAIATITANTGSQIGEFAIGIASTAAPTYSGAVAGSDFVNVVKWISGIATETLSIPNLRVSLAASGTRYLKMMSVYASGQPQLTGARLSARRVR